MTILQKIQHLFEFPFPIIVDKVKNRMVKAIYNEKHKRIATEQDRRANKSFSIAYNYLSALDFKDISIEKPIQTYLIDKYLNHRFDLLGSGWVANTYATEVCGLEEYKYDHNLSIHQFDTKGDWLDQVVLPAHLEVSKQYWEIITRTLTNYEPIDWQKDFKSGFRWNAKRWYKEQRELIAEKKGVDLKVPWELSRLQHLPQLAFFALDEPTNTNRLIKEFKCQVLDFFMTNPIGMGVNFNCPMDVGIRAANILLAYDLFRDLDKENILDTTFEIILAANIYQHGRHILEDIEYREGLTSNHYLANIAGLVYISAYLNRTAESDKWLAFSIQELIRSMDRQFFEDGSNFEGSTIYHRLSGEMMVYSAALIQKLSADKREALISYKTKPWVYEVPLFESKNQLYTPTTSKILPQRFFNKLGRSAYFTEAITKPTGEVPQFGDNDNGRFFKFTPTGQFLKGEVAIKKYKNLNEAYAKQYSEEKYWDENYLDLSSFLTACGSMFGIKKWQKHSLETKLIQQLIGNASYIFSPKASCNNTVSKSWSSDDYPYHSEEFIKTNKKVTNKTLLENLKLEQFQDFQIYIFRSDRLYLSISGIGNENQHHSWGHMHNDKLSFELNLDGQELIVNPGTYLYTPIPERRRLFRKTAAHNTLVVEGEEQNESNRGRKGLFNMKHQTKVTLLEASNNHLTLKLTYRNIKQIRKIEILEEAIRINDYSNVPFQAYFNRFDQYSNGYGKWIN